MNHATLQLTAKEIKLLLRALDSITDDLTTLHDIEEKIHLAIEEAFTENSFVCKGKALYYP